MGGTFNGSYIEVESNHLTKFAVLSIAVPTAEQTEPNDIVNHWAEMDIRPALKSGIIKGYADGTFKPNQSVTRAEFIVMLMNALRPNAQPAILPEFKDGEKIGAWAEQSIALATQENIVNGYSDGGFHPDDRMTRAQLAVVLANALRETASTNGKSTFADVSTIPVWALSAVNRVQDEVLIKGITVNKF